MTMPTRYSEFLTRSYKTNKKYYPAVGMSREAYGESGDRVVVLEVKDRSTYFGFIDIPSITTTLKSGLMTIFFSSSSTNSKGKI